MFRSTPRRIMSTGTRASSMMILVTLGLGIACENGAWTVPPSVTPVTTAASPATERVLATTAVTPAVG